jgi:hypothetical protein
MGLRKRSPSSKISKAGTRLEAMKRIDNRHGKIVNYGGESNPLTNFEMQSQIDECNKLINEYNYILEMADEKAAEIRASEEKTGDLFTRVLAGAKSIFGVDSEEVKELGGTKKSERKKQKSGILTGNMPGSN